MKNQQRWNSASYIPEAYSEIQQGKDICLMQTQCLVRGGAKRSRNQGPVPAMHRPQDRHLLSRHPRAELSEAEIEIVGLAQRMGGKELQSWQEASNAT